MEYERSLNLYQKCENYAMESLKELLDGTDKGKKSMRTKMWTSRRESKVEIQEA